MNKVSNGINKHIERTSTMNNLIETKINGTRINTENEETGNASTSRNLTRMITLPHKRQTEENLAEPLGIKEIINNELETINKIKEEEQGLEDERKTNEYFLKVQTQDLALSVFSLICNY